MAEDQVVNTYRRTLGRTGPLRGGVEGSKLAAKHDLVACCEPQQLLHQVACG